MLGAKCLSLDERKTKAHSPVEILPAYTFNTVKILFSIILLIYSEQVFGQEDFLSSRAIKSDFIKDSLGCSGLRLKHIDVSPSYFDTLTNERRTKILISGRDFLNQKDDTIMSLLGRPNSTSHRAEGFLFMDNYWFYLTTCGNTKPGKTLVVSSFNGQIDRIEIQEK